MSKIIQHPILVNLISNYDNFIWIELGVFRGENAKEIFDKFNSKINKMYLIDPFIPLIQYREEFHNTFGTTEVVNENNRISLVTLKSYNDKCIWIKDFSYNMVNKFNDESIDVIYIDGNHTTEAVLLDLILYYPKIKMGGLIIGDDYHEDGVKRAVKAFGKEYKLSETFNNSKVYTTTPKFYMVK
jgi:hypothetical protein